MHTIWTNSNFNPASIHPSHSDPVVSVYDSAQAATPNGFIGSDLPVSEWKGNHLVFEREDGSGICF